MISERQPSTRLITQNMLGSAALFEQKQGMSWDSIQDLSAFIDLFCLYDHVIVLGRGADYALNNWGSELFELLRDENFVQIHYPKSSNIESILSSASKHLLAFLGPMDAAGFLDLLNYTLTADEAFYCLSHMPDGKDAIDAGALWLKTAPEKTDLVKQLKTELEFSRGTAFLVRTFLYLAFSEVTETAFTADAVRSPVLETVLNSDEQFRGKLLSGLKASFEELPGSKKTLKRTSPFASIVFKRAGKNKAKIVKEMANLRAELNTVRRQLRDIEDRALHETDKDARKSAQEWNDVVDELVLSYEAPSALQVFKMYTTSFHKSLAGVIDKPYSLEKWTNTLQSAAHVKRILSTRMTTIDLHRLLLQGSLGSGALLASIHGLFGEIK